MPRQIKFRAWDTTDNTLQEVNGLLWRRGEVKPYFWDENQYTYVEIPNDKFVLMQFTGLLDKKGKEIYEGDILKRDTGYPYAVEVKWETFEDGEYGYGIGVGFNIHPDDEKDIEIIGNKWEHPELLK